MTKKFWNDWKNRVGETEQVYLCRPKSKWFDYSNSLSYSRDLLNLRNKERILSYKFNDDVVEFVIERKNIVYDEHYHCHYNTQNEYVKINRKDIISIKFKKYETKTEDI